MTPLMQLLETYRRISQSEREKGTYFEELICTYFRYEAGYADLYTQVWTYSQIDWSQYQPNIEPVLREKFGLRPHQEQALANVKKGLESADRGKLIMACGTGKTFVSLKIAEEMAGKGGTVLFLVPSLSLMSQTLTEWTQQSKTSLHSFAVCSDNEVGKKKRNTDDAVQTLVHE
jgi:predicted helicase